MTGINFLLSNQKDKSVELFLDMLKDESNTFEAQLTLGSLFRFRGEVDRAIRIHQALTENGSLSSEQQLLAVQQLGRDYMTAGLYNLAEDIFILLVNEDDFRRSALQQLLQIYQATNEWKKTIDIAEKLAKIGHLQLNLEIAYFYCELALQAMSGDDLDNALIF